MYGRNQRTRWRAIAGLACAGLVGVAAGRPAAAQQPAAGEPAPITVRDPDAVPFSSAELAQALLARLLPADEAGPPRVEVTPAGDGAVTVQVGDRKRVVAIADRNGPAAARVVALVIAELMSGGPTPEDVARADAAPAVTVARSSDEPPASLAASAAPGPSAPLPPLRLSLTGGVAKGAGGEELLAGTVDADVVLPLPGGVRLMPSAGLVYMPTRNPGTWNQVSYTGAMARLLAGGGAGPVDLFAGPFVAPYNIEGATAHAGVLFGAEALARLTAPLSRRLRLVVATRLHAYGNRVRVVWADGAGYATPRFELTIGVGLAWDWTS